MSITSAASANTFTLKEEVFVKGPTVLLGDLASIDGEFADELALVEISSAAEPGASKLVNAALVEARLRSHGVDPALMQIDGARRVKATTLYHEVSREFLAQSLREFVELNMPWEIANSEIDVPLPAHNMLMPEGELFIDWRASPQYQYLGKGVFRGTLLVDGQAERTLTMYAHLEAYADILVATRDISRGRPISPADLETRKYPMSNAPRGALMNPEEAVGQITRKTIFPGQPLLQHQLEHRVLVRRGQQVNVTLSNGTIQLQTRATAKMDGRAGDAILLLNPQSKKEFQGVVLPDGSIHVE